MLGNLLDNAVRHTPSGGQVRVDLAARPNEVELAVTDTGNGIAAADRERVFARFVQLAGRGTSGEGAGLGLPIARAIAEAHGGTLALGRSDAGGSTFLARLPKPGAPPEDCRQRHAASSSVHPRPASVLTGDEEEGRDERDWCPGRVGRAERVRRAGPGTHGGASSSP
jgi:hypothetical protein